MAVIPDITATLGLVHLLRVVDHLSVTCVLLDMNVLKTPPYLYPVLMEHLRIKQELLFVLLALQDHSVWMASILNHVVLVFTALQGLVIICSLALVVPSIQTTV